MTMMLGMGGARRHGERAGKERCDREKSNEL
jgi:hypothetical protein